MFKGYCFVSIDVERDLNLDSYNGVKSINRVLSLFRHFEMRVTLFVTGTILELFADQVRVWAKEHEIACHGFFLHTPSTEFSFEQKEKNIRRFIEIYKGVFGLRPKGFRAVQNVISSEDIELLERTGFAYDSSVVPRYIPLRRYVGYQAKAPLFPYRPDFRDCRKMGRRRIVELPLAPLNFGIPINGTWIRYLTPHLYKYLIFSSNLRFLCLSFHSWDVYPFRGKFSRNSGTRFVGFLEAVLISLREKGYKFICGEQCLKLIENV